MDAPNPRTPNNLMLLAMNFRNSFGGLCGLLASCLLGSIHAQAGAPSYPGPRTAATLSGADQLCRSVINKPIGETLPSNPLPMSGAGSSAKCNVVGVANRIKGAELPSIQPQTAPIGSSPISKSAGSTGTTSVSPVRWTGAGKPSGSMGPAVGVSAPLRGSKQGPLGTANANLPPTPSMGSSPHAKVVIAKPGAVVPCTQALSGKITTQISAGNTLTAAPASAFGFLPARGPGVLAPLKVSAPRAVSIPKTTSALITCSTIATPSVSTAMTVHPAASTVKVAESAPKLNGGQLRPVSAMATTLTATSARTAALPAQTVSTLTEASGPASASVSNPNASPNFAQAALLTIPSVMLDDSFRPIRQPMITSNGIANDYEIDSALGKFFPGGNLFFSFSRFGLLTGESATFSNNTGLSGIHNILARVTGGGLSNIDGTINVSIDGANLFLMNPSGFIFGQNSSLNVPGSFTVTTADYLKLADGNRFNAQSGPADASLSAASVSAFGFLAGKTASPSPVTFDHTFFSMVEGKNFIVVAGDQTIDGAFIVAPAAQLTLVGVAGHGEVPADPIILAATPLELLPALGNITLTGSSFLSAGSSGTSEAGRVEIDAGVVAIMDSSVDASMLAIPRGTAGGASSVLVRGQTLRVSDAGQISAETNGFGRGGTINIQAGDVTLTNGSLIQTITSGESSGGSITLAANTVNISESAIKSSANGAGAAGNIYVTANAISISGEMRSSASGILAESGFASPTGRNFTGQGGDVNIITPLLTLTNGGQISTTTFGPGRGGNIFVSAGNISIAGSSNFSLGTDTFVFQSGILASSGLPGDQGMGGMGGNVALSTDSLYVSNNGLITASTLGSGGGGSLSINAGSIILDGSGATLPTGIAATTSYPTGGKGGDIAIAAGSLQVLGGAEISAATMGTGAGGNISIVGGSALVAGRTSAITAQTTAPHGGTGGNLRLNVNSVSITDAGQISVSTQGSGAGGSIGITASQVTIDGGASIRADTSGGSGIIASAPSAHDVNLTLSVLSADGANSDLRAILVNPASNQVALFNEGDAIGTNLISLTFSNSSTISLTDGVAPYTGTFQPAVPLAFLNGGAANGTWKVKIGTTGSSDATLTSWTLAVNGQQFSDDVTHILSAGSFLSFPLAVTLPSIRTYVQAGPGGNIQINAGTVTARNGGMVSASSRGDGTAGSISITAGNSILLQGNSLISVLSRASDAGSIALTAGRSIELHGGATITASAGANGGSISLRAGNLFFLDYSSLVATAGTQLSLGGVGGTGGNITVDPTFIILDHGLISANAAIGLGGNILLRTDHFLSSESLLTATGSTDGTVKIVSLELDIVAGLIGLPGNVLDVSSQLREQCALRLGEDFSSFLLLGRGGVEASPDEALDEPASERTRDKEESRAMRKLRQKGGVQLALPPASLPR